jgi:DNA-binding MarR family transcriptional regulator
MNKRELVMRVVRGGREFSVGTVLFHQAVGGLLGINVSDVKCLDVIAMQGRATPTELAKHTGLSPGAMTAVIDRLQEAHLVERHRDPQDRRTTLVVLSKHGSRVLPELFRSLGTAMQELVSSYSSADLAVLADFFSKTEKLWKGEREELLARRSNIRKASKGS